MSMRTLILVALVVPTLSLVGCDDETSKPTKDGGADGSTDGSMDATADANVPVYLPSIDELPEGKWSTLVPGGDTVCSRGTPYKFYVYRGTSKNLVVDYMGGGACWNSFTCKASSGLFDDSVETNAEAIFEGPDSARAGLFDMTDERNPVKTYTHVIIPYCTGDVHWGDATQTYGEGAEAQVIHHNGAKNSQAVLDWVYENVVEPEVVLTTGCSAGAYGA
ncbi:MAG: hypothetical protein KC417_00390, partial [Myxococcales bacterium]|nr:hypothetical protein [Myxococcales bacterium]